MPIYEYTCAACRRDLEVIQKITEPPLVRCPACGEDSLKKKTSMAAFHLKGGGWFKDGYGNGKNGEKSATGSTPSGTDHPTDKPDTGAGAPAGPAKENTPAAKETSTGAKETSTGAAAS